MPKGQKGLLTSKTVLSYCWWFRNPAFTSWGEGSLSHHLQGFIHPRWLNFSSWNIQMTRRTKGLVSFINSISLYVEPFPVPSFRTYWGEMSFSSASQCWRCCLTPFPGALQKKIYPINTHYITCIIMGLLIEGPPFFKEFSHHNSLWKENAHLSATSMAACASSGALLGLTVRYTATSIPTTSSITEPFVFLGGSVCLSVKTSSSTNLFQSSTPVFVCKKIYIYICTRVAKVSNFTHPTEILGNTSQQLDGHAIGFPRPRDVGVRIGVSWEISLMYRKKS